MIFLSLPLYKGQTITTLAENGRKGFRALCAISLLLAVIEGSFKRINNQTFDISTKEQTKTLMTCTDNKRWILEDNVHTLAFGHYRLKDM